MIRKTTMTDIALAAGVSQATVSLVLSGAQNARVSAATRARVIAEAERLGYRPRRGTRPASGAKVVALVIDEVALTPHASPFLETLREEAAARGWLAMSFVTGRDAGTEAAAFDLLASLPLAGVAYTSLITRKLAAPARLAEFPAVLVNCYEETLRLPTVLPDDAGGGAAAAEALIRAGHRRIAHIPGERWIEAARSRLRGYRQALTRHGIFDAGLIGAESWTVSSGRAAMAALLARPERPDAVFCFSDRVALGAYEAARAAGLRIPEDLSVIGFDNEEFGAHLDPPLASLTLPHDEMMRRAVECLECWTEGAAPQRISVDCPLTPRASLAPPR